MGVCLADISDDRLACVCCMYVCVCYRGVCVIGCVCVVCCGVLWGVCVVCMCCVCVLYCMYVVVCMCGVLWGECVCCVCVLYCMYVVCKCVVVCVCVWYLADINDNDCGMCVYCMCVGCVYLAEIVNCKGWRKYCFTTNLRCLYLDFRGPASSQLYISGGVHRKKNIFRSNYSYCL